VVDPGRAYVARAHSSESDGQFEFAISAPLCREHRWVGIIESGYVVSVQSRRDVTPLARVLVEKLALPAGIPFSMALLATGSLGLARRPRPTASSTP